jgi:allantoinase
MANPAKSAWTWPGGAKLALSVVVNVEEGAEFNILDGDRGPSRSTNSASC